MKKLFSTGKVIAFLAVISLLAFAPGAPREWAGSQWLKSYTGIGKNPNTSDKFLHVKGSTGRPGTVIQDDDSSVAVTVNDSSIILQTVEGVYLDSASLQEYKGANVASASVITLGPGNFFDLTGTTTVNRLVITDKQAGYRFALQANGAVTIADSSVTGAAAGNVMFRTKSGSNLSMDANNICDFIYDGTVVWQAGEQIALEN